MDHKLSTRCILSVFWRPNLLKSSYSLQCLYLFTNTMNFRSNSFDGIKIQRGGFSTVFELMNNLTAISYDWLRSLARLCYSQNLCRRLLTTCYIFVISSFCLPFFG
jgi:hypothetical protein